MKMQSKFFSKRKIVNAIIKTIIVLIIITIAISWNSKYYQETINSMQEEQLKLKETLDEKEKQISHFERTQETDGNPSYIIRSFDTYSCNDEELTLPILNVMGLPDMEFEKKVDQSIRSCFIDWMPEEFKHFKPDGSYVMMQTDRYLSIFNSYHMSSGNYTYVCNTIDMKSGEVVYLEDLLLIDEKLVDHLLTKGILKTDTMGEPPREDYEYTEEMLKSVNKELMFDRLKRCSESYTEGNYKCKPSFYLRENRLYFVSVLSPTFSECYVKLDDLENWLKVDKW